MSDDLLYFNGVNGATGLPLVPSMSPDDMTQSILQQDLDESEARKNRLRLLLKAKNTQTLGVREAFQGHEDDLSQVGWGLIYSPNTPQDVLDALSDLTAHRQCKGRLYKYTGGSAYQFRKAHGEDYGLVDPDKLPYYLLIVGPPTDISFEFQYELDAEHAVGRLCFATPQEYRSYAQKVIAYETATQTSRQRRVAFFAPDQDAYTRQSANLLAKELAKYLEGKDFKTLGGPISGWEKLIYQVEGKYGADAKQTALLDLFTRTSAKPSLLFTASHGLGFDSGDPRQLTEQGAILCQEYPGITAWPGGKIPSNMYCSGSNIPKDLDLSGLVVFSFACYSAGTPQDEAFAKYYNPVPHQLAVDPFVAYLPQRLLAQGALAFIGHVDQTYTYSYGWPGVGRLGGAFEDTLAALLKGKRIGHAFEPFNRRYLDLNNDLTGQEGLFKRLGEDEPVAKDIVEVWTARNDAQSYVVFGDPAVRLRPEIMTVGH